MACLLAFAVVVGPAYAQLTRSEAIQVLEREVTLDPDIGAWSPLVDFGSGPGFEGLLPAGATVEPFVLGGAPEPGSIMSAGESYVFLVDDEPGTRWAYPIRYVVIDANQPFLTATAVEAPQAWWKRITASGFSGRLNSIDADQEVPAPVLGDSVPDGSMTVVLDENAATLSVSASYTGTTSNVTGAHIHGPAPAGMTAGIAFDFLYSGGTSGTFSGTWAGLTAQEISDIKAGLYYVNVHTTNNNSGEIRGQIDTGSVDLEFFEDLVTYSAAGATNPEGLVRGDTDLYVPDPFPVPKATTNPPSLAAPQPIGGDPCAILVGGATTHGVPQDIDRFEMEFKDRGVPASRIKKKKAAKLSDLQTMVTEICALTPKCDKIFVVISSHGKPDSLFFQGSTKDERAVTESELVSTLCPLASKDAPLCILIDACYSGSLVDSLQGKFPGASIFTAASDSTTAYGGTYYDKPSSDPSRVRVGTFSVFSKFFSDCWDSTGADLNDPKNGVDWEEAWTWVCAKDPTVYIDNRVRRPKLPGPVHPTPVVSGSVWVNSWTCAPGENLTIKVHGTVKPSNKPVTWCIENGRTGLKANTPVGGTDSTDLGGVDTSPQTPDVMPDGRFWDETTVQCPVGQSGQVAVYKVKLKVDGATVDLDYGCVSIIGPDPVLPAERPRVVPDPDSGETDEGVPTQASYTIINESTNPAQYVFIGTVLNHYDLANGILFPAAGIAFVDSGDGTGTMYGVTDPVPPFSDIGVVFDVIPVSNFGFLSGLTVDLALFAHSEVGINASVTVLGLPGTSDATPPSPRFQLAQNWPNPFNPYTTIRYNVGSRSNVRLEIFDARGRLIKTLVSMQHGPGDYVVTWDGRDDAGRRVGSATYYYRLLAGDYRDSRKLTVVR